MARHARRRSIALGVGLATTVVLFEVAGRAVFRDPVRALGNVDHRPRPNGPLTNGDGIRSKADAAQVRAEDVSVVFLGDSFAWGAGLTGATVPELLEGEARRAFPQRTVRVFNFGWISSSPRLSLRRLRDVGAKYRPDAVILLVDATDFYDDLKHKQLLEQRGFFALLGVAPAWHYALREFLWRFPPVWEFVFQRPADWFFVVNRPLEESRPWLGAILESIDALAEYSRDALGARFFLVQGVRAFQYTDQESPRNWEAHLYVPRGPWVREPFRFLEEELRGRDIPYLSLLPAFEGATEFPLYFEDDPHWNEAGARVAARAIFEFCVERGCFE